jgi:hypothetical protein
MTIEVVTFGCRLNTHESEAIRQAAREHGVKPSETLTMSKHKPPAVAAARNVAIRLAYDQGITTEALSDAFSRSPRTILDSLRLTRPD